MLACDTLWNEDRHHRSTRQPNATDYTLSEAGDGPNLRTVCGQTRIIEGWKLRECLKKIGWPSGTRFANGRCKPHNILHDHQAACETSA